MNKPCKECPFRKVSAPGYLGEVSYQPEEFLASIEHFAIPCHLAVDWEHDDQEAMNEALPCLGALQFQRNSGKSPRNPAYNKLVAAVTKNEDVFNWRHEFIKHHERKDNTPTSGEDTPCPVL